MHSTAPHLPTRENNHAGLVVRPDVVKVRFVVRVSGLEVEAAVGFLKSAVDVVARRVHATATGATVRMLGLGLGTEASGKSKGGGDNAVSVDGVVEVPLAPSLDYWGRAQLLATMNAVASSSAEEARRLKPPLDSAYAPPVALVRDPEQFRGEILKLWVARARQVAAASHSDVAPLYLLDCSPPGAITQTPMSLEEVELVMPLSGRIDVLPGAR